MKYEISLIESVKNKYLGVNEDLDSKLTDLSGAMSNLIQKFDEQQKGNFNIAKNVVVMLHKILTSPDEAVKGWISKFPEPDVASSLSKLHALSTNSGCRSAMAEMHTLFSGRCIELSSVYVSFAKEGVLRFTPGQLGVNKEPETMASLEEKRKKAEEDFEKVSNFCYRHRV